MAINDVMKSNQPQSYYLLLLRRQIVIPGLGDKRYRELLQQLGENFDGEATVIDWPEEGGGDEADSEDDWAITSPSRG